MERIVHIISKLILFCSLSISFTQCKLAKLENSCDIQSQSYLLSALVRFATADTSPSCLPGFAFFEEWGIYGGVFGPPAKVHSILSYRNHILIGGDFTLTGVSTGSVPVVNAQTGTSVPNRLCPYLKVKGPSYAAVSDGNGGFYIGGEFTHVQGKPRSQIAHILPGCQLDPNFNVTSDPNRIIYALHVSGDQLYVGGFFASWGSGPQKNIASLNRYSGELNTGFNLGDIDNYVYGIVSFGNSLFIGGTFQSIVSIPRYGIAKLDRTTGTIDSSFTSQLGIGGVAYDLMLGTDFQGSPVLYVAGSFTTPRSNVAAYYLDGTLHPWAPNPDFAVEALEQYENIIYLGGGFSSVLGAASANFLVGVDNHTGTAMQNQFAINQSVSSLDIIGNQLYVLGQFTEAKGSPRRYAASFSLPSGSLTAWNPSLEEAIFNPGGTVVPIGNDVAIAYHRFSVNIQPKKQFLVIDDASGSPIDGTPEFDFPIKSMHIQNDKLYIGGSFELVNGMTRRGFAILDLPTYQLKSTDLQISDPSIDIRTITSSSDQIFFGGSGLAAVRGQTRNGVAAISNIDFNVTNWNPNLGVGNSATSLLVIGDAIYVGGLFNTMNGDNTINNFRAVDLVNGTKLNTPSTVNYPNSDVTTQILYNGKIYLGGIFTSISGLGTFSNFAIFDLTTQTYQNPNPIYANGFVNTITPSPDGRVLVGGSFSGLNGSTTTNYLSAFQSHTNSILNWVPNPDSSAYTSLYHNGKWIVGGEFIHAFQKPYGGILITDLTEPSNN